MPLQKDSCILHQFLAGIPEAVSRQIRASGEVHDLEKVVERARLLMTVNEMSNMGSVQAAAIGKSRPTDPVTKKLEEQVAKLTEQVASLSTRTPQGSGRQRQRPRYLRCFKCNRVGHTQYECSYEHQMQTPAGTGDVLRVVALATSRGIVIHKETSGRKDQATSSRETTKGCPYGGTGIPGSNSPPRH